jgi:soluble cytochrome b562
MDHNYRGAIAHVEQADQLVRNATSPADIELGAQKVQLAQKNLDALPVWFLGYEPQMYCTFTRCVWYFTFDEYKAARAQVGRMEAIVFQEENALTQLNQAESNLTTAKEQFSQSTTATQQQQAVGAWQAALDQLQQLPPQTLAGRTAQTKLTAYQRDFQGLVGKITGSNRTLTLIEAAKQFGNQAAEAAQNPPHSAAKWQTIEELWQEAIQRLEMVPDDGVDYLEAQKLLATYETNLREIRLRRQAEQEAVQLLDEVQGQVQQLQKNASSWQQERIISELEGISYKLNKIQPGTMAYNQAQALLAFATQKRDQLNGR